VLAVFMLTDLSAMLELLSTCQHSALSGGCCMWQCEDLMQGTYPHPCNSPWQILTFITHCGDSRVCHVHVLLSVQRHTLYA
jgi:hypothetical protein